TLAANVRGAVKASTHASCKNNANAYSCPKFKFTNASGNSTTYNVTNCVAERTNDAYTDVSPSTSPLSFVYSPAGSPCPTNPIVPLTDSKSTLKTAITNLNAAGTTAGHIGIAWGWYMVSPNFGYLFPGSSQPNSYGDKKTMKVAVLMTDGEFNTQYCNGVVSKDSSGAATSERINCNAPNGSSFAQAATLCANMKKAGVIVYSVGFGLTTGGQAETTLKNCASSTSAPYFNNAKSGSDLKAVFKQIAKSISQLKIAH
ncbi:MAG: pilus assembly protein TadG, partial [Caulobacterales bacterium]